MFLRFPNPPTPAMRGGRVDEAVHLFLRLVAPGRQRPGRLDSARPPTDVGRRVLVSVLPPQTMQCDLMPTPPLKRAKIHDLPYSIL